MSNGRYNYYDPEFNPDETQDNSLLILITGETFSFTVMQLESNKVLVWGDQYSINELASPDTLKPILTAKYASTKISVQSLAFSIIPNELFDRNKIAEYAQFLSKQANDIILINDLDTNNFVVFKVAANVAEAISTNFDLKSVSFGGKALLAGINFARPYNQPLYIHIESNVIQLVYFADNKLRFYNAFEFNNADEIMYYTILVANELDINLDATSVILGGDISLSDKKIHRINDMLPKVYFNQNNVVALPDGFMPHQILMLAGLSLCELSVAG